jgi:WD40 repeat protein
MVKTRMIKTMKKKKINKIKKHQKHSRKHKKTIRYRTYSRKYKGGGGSVLGSVMGFFKRERKLLMTLTGHSNWVTSVSFSPDGSQIVSGSRDKTIRVWDAVTGKIIKELEGHTGPVMSVSYSPDGSRIVSGSDDNTVRVWATQLKTDKTPEK